MWRSRLENNIYLDNSSLDQAGLEYVESMLSDLGLKAKVLSKVPDAEVPGKLIITCVENPLVYNYSRQEAVVEDNLLNRMVVESYLKNSGIDVVSAENGQEA